MIMEERDNLKYDEFIVFKLLDEQFNKLVKRFETKIPNGSIGVESIRFGKLYFEVAIYVFRNFRVEFPVKVFNKYWNSRLKSDRRITIHQDVNVQIDEMMLTSVSEFSDTPFLALCDNVDMICNSGAVNIGWNNGMEINDEFIERYLRKYFEEEILPEYNKGLSEFIKDSKENKNHQFKYSVFGMDSKGCLNKEFWILSFFTTITPRIIFKHFEKFAKEQGISVSSNERDAYFNQNILEITFWQN